MNSFFPHIIDIFAVHEKEFGLCFKREKLVMKICHKCFEVDLSGLSRDVCLLFEHEIVAINHLMSLISWLMVLYN